MEPAAPAAIDTAWLNLEPLPETYLQRQPPGGCYDPLARHDGRSTGNGRGGLRHRMDDFRPGRARCDRGRLGVRALRPPSPAPEFPANSGPARRRTCASASTSSPPTASLMI